MKDTLKAEKQPVLELNYIGNDDWDRPVYKDQNKMLWKDIELGDNETPALYYAGKEFDGEPHYPIRKEYVIVTPFVKNHKKFESMMLNRLQNDCKTHLDRESKYARRLSENEKKGVIEEMKKLWNVFEDHEKPVWITWEEILNYEKQMLG